MSTAARFCYWLGLALYAAVFFKNAWVSDDAYILFRSLEQLLDGNGPRWNPHERVQVFTCPLWYWLLAVMGSIWRNHYFNSILLSAACNLLLLWNLQKIFASARIWLLAVMMLVFSQAFFDFTSSGLENPLAYCLLSFVARFHLNREQLAADKALLYSCIAAGLLLVTRHDLLLFVLPLLLHDFLLHGFYRAPRSLAAWAPGMLALLLPLALWTLFSLLYYGFPFPNTAYAKLGVSIPHEWLLERGIGYFKTSVWRDFISVAVLPVGVVAGLLSRHTALRTLALGIVLHLAYVLWIGGDFMRGRFFSWDYLLCVITLLYPLGAASAWRQRITVAFATMAAAVSWLLWEPPLVTPLQWGTPPFQRPDTADGITQERHFYFWFTALWKTLQRDTPLLYDHGWCNDGLEQRRQGITVAASRTVGMHGFCLGTDLIIIDMLGITDPLLARMPRDPSQQNWRPGHFTRLLPDGYCTSVRSGNNRVTAPVIADYYDKIRLLTQSADLFSRERLLAIWQMNTGGYRQQLQQAHAALTQQFTSADGPSLQRQALHDCPFVELPPALIEQLKKSGE